MRVKFIIMRQNAHEVTAMREGATARGVAYLIDMTVTARHDGTRGSLAAQIDRGQLEALCRGPLRDLLPIGRRPPPPAESFNCNCARGNCAVSARGDVYPCISVPWLAGNVREQAFRDIWRDSPVFKSHPGADPRGFSAVRPLPSPRLLHARPRRRIQQHRRGLHRRGSFVCATAEITHKLVAEGATTDATANATTDAVVPVTARAADSVAATASSG